MMKKTIMLFALAVLSAAAACGQSKFNLSGTIIEKGTNEAVIGASVRVLATKDSALVTGAATDLNGAFKIQNVKKDRYIVQITSIGFLKREFALDLNAEKKKDVDMGYLTLSPDEILLKEATVTAAANKVQVSGDSIVYNADAYRLAEGSTLEDLVKRLPGATVDKDGTIKVNGKEVKKILLDGKEFFINDKSIALKNLPTNIIDRVKAYDRKSDLARVTGIDDGEEETVLDLTVKKGKNNGWFGQLSAGAGTEDRYSARMNVNRFNGANQYSIFANANNVGDMGFGGGGGRGFWGGGSGLRASKDIGYNFATISKNEKLESGGYIRHRYDGSDSWSKTATQNFVTQTGAFNNSVSQSYSSNSSVNAGFRFEWKPDTMTNIIFRPNFNYSRNRGSSASESGSYDQDPNSFAEDDLAAAEDAFGQLRGSGIDPTRAAEDIADDILGIIVNTNRSRSQSYSYNVGGNGELQLNRKFNNRGRNLTLRLTGGFTDSGSKQLSAASINYRQSAGRDADINNRYYDTPGRSRNFSVQTTYSEPIADRTYLQFSYRFAYSYNKSDRGAYTFDAGAYADLRDALLANRYDIPGALSDLLGKDHTQSIDDNLCQFSQYKNMDHTISLMFRRTRDNYNFNAGIDLLPQHSELDYKYMGKEYPKITRNVFNFTPTLNLRYRFDDMTNLQFTYRGRSSQPSMTDLLDITDDSNPLNIRKGNPGLKPSFSSNFRLFFNTFDVEHQRSIFTHLYFQMQQNAISSRTSYDQLTGVRTTRPENINGNWSIGGGGGLNTAIDSEKLFTFSTFTNFSYSNSVSYLDPTQYEDDRSTTKRIGIMERLELAYRNTWFEVSVNGDVDWNHSKNNVLTTGNLDTWDFSYGLDTHINTPWGTSFSSDIAMNSRRGYAQSTMNTNELIWNAQLAHSFLKGKALTVSFEWNDILKKQSNISRTIDAMQSSDSRYNAIYSYGLVRVIYKLNIFGGKNANGTSNEHDQWGHGPGGPGGPGHGPGPRH